MCKQAPIYDTCDLSLEALRLGQKRTKENQSKDCAQFAKPENLNPGLRRATCNLSLENLQLHKDNHGCRGCGRQLDELQNTVTLLLNRGVCGKMLDVYDPL